MIRKLITVYRFMTCLKGVLHISDNREFTFDNREGAWVHSLKPGFKSPSEKTLSIRDTPKSIPLIRESSLNHVLYILTCNYQLYHIILCTNLPIWQDITAHFVFIFFLDSSVGMLHF
jgi:hypothetical protein